MKTVRHPDFQKIFTDFLDLRNGEQGQVLYLRFLEHYDLDETKPYELKAQRRLLKFKLNAPTHLRIKEQYPMFGKDYWDSFIVGRKRIGKCIHLRSDHPVKLKFKGLRGRVLNIKFGGEN